jgi:hypothetical protein
MDASGDFPMVMQDYSGGNMKHVLGKWVMSTTTEPTEAERALARAIAFALYGGPFDDYDKETGGAPDYYTDRGVELLRQHVAAEVAKETASFQTTITHCVEEMNQLKAGNARLLAELAELRRFKARCEWLAEHSSYSGGGSGGVYSWSTPLDSECFYEQLDAAMEACK